MKTYQKLCDGKFSVEMEVTGKGEPLLFLHGAGGLTGADPFLEDLGRNFKVYAPHLPGYGESTGGEHIDDVIDAALFYHELMDELDIPSANLVGHSMGGMLAAEVAALDTHRAKKLVLVGAAGFWLDDTPIPDLFASDLDDLPALLFHDPQVAAGADDYRDAVGQPGTADRDVRRASQALLDGEQVPVADSGPRTQEARLPDSRADAAGMGRVGQGDSSGLRA